MYRRSATRKEAHTDSIWTVGWGPSMHIVSGSVDGTVKRWEHNEGTTAENEEVKTAETITHSSSFAGHQLGVVSTALHPSGNLMATTCVDCRIRIYDMQDCSLTKEIDAGAVESWTASFSGLKPHLATGSQRGAVNVFSHESGEKLTSMDTGGGFVMSVGYSPDGQFIAAGCNSGMVSVFDSEHGTRLMKHTTSHTMPVRSTAFSKDSMLLLTASDDKHVNIYDPRQSQVVASLAGHSSWVLSVCMSPDGQRFATGSADNKIKIWDLGLRRCVHTFDDHADQVWSVAYNESGTRLVSGGDDGTLNVFQLEV